MKEVRFKANLHSLSSSSGNYGESKRTQIGIAGWLCHIFGFSRASITLLIDKGEAIIVCSPERFVQFLIEQRNRGHSSIFRDLEVEMIDIPLKQEEPLILRAEN